MEDGKKSVMYGNPVVTPMDIARNGGIMEDVYGSMEEYWEEQDERVRLKVAERTGDTAKGDVMPKVKCKLVGEDGNAFAILGRFQHAARKAKWPADEIKKVVDEAMTGDYNHLLVTIRDHCEDA